MTSLKEKERRKEQQEKFQAILSALLKDEDNKYCVDCDAKGPRWASWNLGIFLCIRCAGIHRNLGVHISKVKSVNLDSWTPEQMAMVQEMGNSRARAVYEANLPDGYRRPQTDSALEAFIRSKYEQKKYIAKEWIPPQPKVPKEAENSAWLEEKAEKKKTKSKPASSVQLSNVPKASTPSTEATKAPPAAKAEVAVPAPTNNTPAPSTASNDLLGLEPPAAATSSSGSSDLLEFFGTGQPAQASNTGTAQPLGTSSVLNGNANEAYLFGEDQSTGGEKKASTKDSIMALFGGQPSQPQMFGVPGGMYIPQNQQMYPNMMGQPQQPAMMGQMPQGMMGQPQPMMGQAQPMMGQPQAMMGQAQPMMGQMPPAMMGNTNISAAQPCMFGAQAPAMATAPGMYTPQQMQQLQFQQMQQQMTNMKVNGAQMGSMPQQTTPGAGSWGSPAQGQTLSTNLWQ